MIDFGFLIQGKEATFIFPLQSHISIALPRGPFD
jgi:hypothetical protein